MRNTLCAALAAWLALAGAARAGDGPPLDYGGAGHDTQVLPRFWAEADYLLLWVKAAPVPPLLTTGPAPVLGPGGAPGTLGPASTAVVLGGENVDFSMASGVRATAGAWLDDGACHGVEATFLHVWETSEQRGVASTGLPGSRPLSVPFVDARSGRESSVAIALARPVNPIAGAAQLSVTTRLNGAEALGASKLYEGSTPYLGARLDLLYGYRWLGLDENLFFSTRSNVVGVADAFRTTDSFRASNDFHGLEVGLREQVYFGRLYLRGAAKVALGNVHQLTRADGSLVTDDFANLAGNPQRFAGGYLAQPSNTGRFATDRLAWCPEASLGAGLHVCEWLRLSLSYTFLYLSTVARPGDQVDRVINPSQAPAITGDPNAALQGPPRPAYQGRSNEFWMQGLSVGAEVRF